MGLAHWLWTGGGLCRRCTTERRGMGIDSWTQIHGWTAQGASLLWSPERHTPRRRARGHGGPRDTAKTEVELTAQSGRGLSAAAAGTKGKHVTAGLTATARCDGDHGGRRCGHQFTERSGEVGAVCSCEANGARVGVRGDRDAEIGSSGRASVMTAAALIVGAAAREKARGGPGWMRRACGGRWSL